MRLGHAWRACLKMLLRTCTAVYILTTIRMLTTVMNEMIITAISKMNSLEDMAHHRWKFVMFKDGFNR